jgi:hypothetical protein
MTEPPAPAQLSRFARWMMPESRTRRLILAALVYVVCASAFATVAGPARLTQHTNYNHFALLADAWLHGHQNLPNGPPHYAGNNDFVRFEGKTFISFPPFPAVLMLPLVKLAGSAEDFRDGQFVIWLAGIAPAVLFLVLEKLRRTGRSPRSERQNLVLAALFAFGTVYFFTAVEGTVWFAAQVVGAGLMALYLLFALDAERPLLAGVMMACMYLTRSPMLLTAVLFGYEALRAPDGRSPFKRIAIFSAPILVAFAIVAWMNFARYHSANPLFFDHIYLDVGWKPRMQKWGLLSFHYLGKNLGVALTSLPWLPPPGGAESFGAPFKINEHGLALWFTTPLYFWLLWPKKKSALYAAVAVTSALPMAMDFFYQNTGWRQFGYRFSNDYSLLLFVLLAIGARPMRVAFSVAAAWSVAWNLFGAVTFDHPELGRFYFTDGSQQVVYQPD